MKLIFDYTAKMYVLEGNKKLSNHFTHDGLEFLEFHNLYLYVDSKKGKVKYTKNTISTFFLLIENDMYMYMTTGDGLEQFKERFQHNKWKDLLEQKIKEYKVIIQDVDGYNEQKQKELARQREDRLKEHEERNRKALEKAQKELEELQQKLDDAKETFINGGQIPYNLFEMLCTRYDVQIPIRTLGAARKHIVTIGKDQSSVYKSLNSIFIYSNELYNAMTEETTEIDEDVQKLFGKV